MKRIYVYILSLALFLSIGLFFYFNSTSVEDGVLSELDLDAVERISAVESDNPGGMIDQLNRSEHQLIIDELKQMQVRRVNLFSATRPLDTEYVIFLETNAGRNYQVQVYESENLISFSSANDDVNSSRSYKYGESQFHQTVRRLFSDN